MDIITRIFQGLIQIVASFATFLRGLFDSAISIFFDGDLLPLGYFLLIGLGTGLLLWGFNFIRKFIRIRRG